MNPNDFEGGEGVYNGSKFVTNLSGLNLVYLGYNK